MSRYVRIDDTWYLLGGDHYLSARIPVRTRPAFSVIDRPGVYAAKRMFDGKRHIWTGWAWDTTTLRDSDAMIWGGDQCLPRELYPGPEGQLFCRPAQEIEAAFGKEVKAEPETGPGIWNRDRGLTAASEGEVNAACRYTVPPDYMFSFTFRALDPASQVSLLMRQQADAERAYRFTLRPEQGRVSAKNADRTHDHVVVDTAAPSRSALCAGQSDRVFCE